MILLVGAGIVELEVEDRGARFPTPGQRWPVLLRAQTVLRCGDCNGGGAGEVIRDGRGVICGVRRCPACGGTGMGLTVGGAPLGQDWP